MKKIALLLDSSCGLNRPEAKKLGIELEPLLIIENNAITYKDGIDIDPPELYKKLESKARITTSQTPLGVIMSRIEDLLQSNDVVLCVPIASGISGTYGSWKQLEKQRVHVLDAKCLSHGNVFIALLAKQLAENGASFEKIDETVARYVENTAGMLCCTNFKQLVQGGRINVVKGAVAKLFRLNVLIEFANGRLEMLDKFRDDELLIEKMKSEIFARLQLKDFSEVAHASFLHSFPEAANEKKERVKTLLAKAFGKDFVLEERSFPAVISCHIGTNGYAVLVTKKLPG